MSDPRRSTLDRVEPRPSSTHQDVLVVELAGRSLGLPLEVVDEVQPAAEVTVLPGLPPVVEGVVDLRGEPVAVLCGRRRTGAPPREVRLSDRLVVLRTATRRVALRVDAAVGLAQVATVDLGEAASLAPEALRRAGLARLDDGLLMVHDPDAFLSAEEDAALGAAIAEHVAASRS